MEKKIFLLGLLAILALGLAGTLNEIKPSDKEKKTISFEESRIKVEIADTAEERQKGLSGRENLPAGQGLLFVFEKEGFYSFWMKDMNFPIDIIWLDENWQVVHLEKNISSETFPTIFTSPLKAQYVLEVNAGLVQENQLRIGDILFK